ncbi:hypothetical protein GKR41_00752 [Candidatus Vallotia lariciata]|nr:hypothetical protein GKR41_00752 [Candidatus Vallotia lariciata]
MRLECRYYALLDAATLIVMCRHHAEVVRSLNIDIRGDNTTSVVADRSLSVPGNA